MYTAGAAISPLTCDAWNRRVREFSNLMHNPAHVQR